MFFSILSKCEELSLPHFWKARTTFMHNVNNKAFETMEKVWGSTYGECVAIPKLDHGVQQV